MEVLKIPKIPKKYICKICYYDTISKKDYNKHLLTPKHIKREHGHELEVMEVTKIPGFICKCNKKFICHLEKPEDTDHMGRFKRCVDKN